MTTIISPTVQTAVHCCGQNYGIEDPDELTPAMWGHILKNASARHHHTCFQIIFTCRKFETLYLMAVFKRAIKHDNAVVIHLMLRLERERILDNIGYCICHHIIKHPGVVRLLIILGANLKPYGNAMLISAIEQRHTYPDNITECMWLIFSLGINMDVTWVPLIHPSDLLFKHVDKYEKYCSRSPDQPQPSELRRELYRQQLAREAWIKTTLLTYDLIQIACEKTWLSVLPRELITVIISSYLSGVSLI